MKFYRGVRNLINYSFFAFSSYTATGSYVFTMLHLFAPLILELVVQSPTHSVYEDDIGRGPKVYLCIVSSKKYHSIIILPFCLQAERWMKLYQDFGLAI